MHNDLNLQQIQKSWHGSLKSYLIGLIVSLILTITSFVLVSQQLLSPSSLIIVIISLGLLQAIFQLRYFLHLGEEPKPDWEHYIFYFMLLILAIVVAGSLWIIYDLDGRVMSNMFTMKKEMSHD